MGYTQPVPHTLTEALAEAKELAKQPPRQMNLARVRVVLEWFIEHHKSRSSTPVVKSSRHEAGKKTKEKASENQTIDNMLKGLE